MSEKPFPDAPLSRIASRIIQTLKQRRLELGLTQRQVAAQIGTEPQALSCYELQKNLPTLSMLIRWCRVLDFEICFVRTQNFYSQTRPRSVALKLTTATRSNIARLAREAA